MCEVISLVVGVLGAVATAAQQADNQRRQFNYQDRLARANEKSAAQAAAQEYLTLAERTSQIRESAAQEAFDASREAEVASGQLQVGAEFAGLTGGSISDLRSSIAIKAAEDAALRFRNLSWEEAQIQRSMDSVNAQYQNRLNGMMPQPVPGVDYAGLLGGLGNAAFGYMNLRNQGQLNKTRKDGVDPNTREENR